MTPSDYIDPAVVLQKFKSEDGKSLPSLPAHVCEATGEQYVLWRDIQDAFVGVSHLQDFRGSRVLFTVDDNGEM